MRDHRRNPDKTPTAKVAPYAFFFLLGIVVALLAQKWMPFSPRQHPNGSPPAATNNLQTSSGPWGTIEYKKIPLEDSEDVFLDSAERLRKPKWSFAKFSQQQVADLFQSADLTAEQKAGLLDTNRWEISTNGCFVIPADEIVLRMSQGSRQQIYSALSRCAGNYNQTYPFRFPPGGFTERFAICGLPSEKIEFIRSLTYTNFGMRCFCDFQPVQRQFSTNEFQTLIKTLYAVPTVRMRLRVTPESNVDALLNYWGKGGRAKQLRPLFESLARVPGGDIISVSYLLPTFARLRLYTFPDVEADPTVAKEDCFFTALNFFNEQPDAHFLDSKNTRKALQSEYSLTQDAPVFGDLIALANNAGDAVHICVYIADNVVFTKNGANYLQPWVLMKISDMLAYFPSEEPLRMVTFRRKEL